MRVLARPLHVAARRHDRAGAHEQRHAFARRRHRDGLAARYPAAGVRIVPARTGGQVHRALARAELGHGRDQQGGAEKVLVVEGPGAPVGGEVHHQRAHHRAVIEPGVGREGVDVGQQPVAQAVVVGQALQHRRIVLGDDRGFPDRVFAVAAEQRGEGAELEPAQVELAPFGKLRRVFLREPILEREAADVVRPVGDARDRQVGARADLVAQVVPACGDVARPQRRRGALHAAEAAAGEDERAPVGLGLAQALGDALGVDERVGIEDRRAGNAGSRRGHLERALLDREVRVPVGLGRVHPPGIEALRDQRLADLAEIDVAGFACVGIVEGVGVAGADPVLLSGFERSLVQVALGRELPRVRGVRIEFRPDRDHDAAVESVDAIHHARGIGEAGGIEGMAAPLVLGPVEPILHDRVDRDILAAVLLEHVDELRLRLVALARLPEPVGPARHHRRLAGEAAVARDERVHVGAGDDVIVDRLAGIGREADRMAVFRWQRIGVLERDVTLVGLPLDAQLDRLALDKIQLEVVVPGVPVLPPAAEHFLVVGEDLCVARRVEAELVRAAGLRVEAAGPDDALGLHRVAGGVLAGGGGDGLRFRLLGPARLIADVLVVDRLLGPGQHPLGAEVVVGLPPGCELLVRLRIADARDRGVVPQHAVAARRQQVGHGDRHVVLGEFDVLAVVVHLAILVLAEAVEPFVGATVELDTGGEPGLTFEGDRRQRAGRCVFVEQQLAGRVVDRQPAVGERDGCRGAGGLEGGRIRGRGKGGLAVGCRHDHRGRAPLGQRLGHGDAERAVGIGEDAHGLSGVGGHLHPVRDLARLAGERGTGPQGKRGAGGGVSHS